MRAVALGRPAASVDELPIAPRYLRADLASNQSPCLLMAHSGSQCMREVSSACNGRSAYGTLNFGFRL